METADRPSGGPCDGCGTVAGPLMKLSLGRDFFGRVYDRLSPAADQRPKWYCEPCSTLKNLQRDFRDIKMEFAKLVGGQPSELARVQYVRRAHVRLQEIAAILSSETGGSRFVDLLDVTTLIQRMQGHAAPSVSA